MVIKPVEEFERVETLDVFFDELFKLYNKSEEEKKKYMKFLFAELHKIENRTEKSYRAEPICYKGIKLYSIRKRMKKNTRVLYYYKKDDRVLLVTAFDENNESDYENAKERAYRRLKTLDLI